MDFGILTIRVCILASIMSSFVKESTTATGYKLSPFCLISISLLWIPYQPDFLSLNSSTLIHPQPHYSHPPIMIPPNSPNYSNSHPPNPQNHQPSPQSPPQPSQIHPNTPPVSTGKRTYLNRWIQSLIARMLEQGDRLNGKPKHINLPQADEHHAEMPFYGKCMHCWGECCGCARTWMPCLCCCFIDYPYKIVPQAYNGIYQQFGRYVRTVKPGLHYINPCTQTLGMISTKIHVLDLARQNIITKDNVSINIDAAVYYRVTVPRYAFYRVQNFSVAIAEVTYAILKNTCGQFILQDLLEKRQEIAQDIEKQVDQYIEEWGVDIQEIFIKDIQLSKDLQDSLSSAAKERRLAESKIISARADVESAKLMRLAAEELNSKAAMQIRYLQTLKQVGRSNTKVIFIPDMKNKERVNHLITQGLIS